MSLPDATVWLYGSDASTYVDVTQYVLSVGTTRGKSRELDYYEPGSLIISFNNYSRVFDPTNTSSPLNGYIVPRRRISVNIVGTGDVFIGLIDNWSFTYDVSGESIATVTASEKTALFSNQFLGAQSFPAELSGARVSRILADDNVAWPTGWGSQVIDPGTQMLSADSVEAGTNVLDYLRSIESSEQGQLYITGTDSLTFQDNNHSITTGSYLTFSDNGTGYGYESIEVSFSTELLYNRIVINSSDGVSGAVANVPQSQELYGLFQYNLDNVLYQDYPKLLNLATWLSKKYESPEYRFSSLRINLGNVSVANQSTLLINANLNNFAKVIFTPNGIGSAIERFVRVIGVSHEILPGSHYVTFQLESIKTPTLVLNDVEFGKLDSYSLGL
jgi:hypothetical protein